MSDLLIPVDPTGIFFTHKTAKLNHAGAEGVAADRRYGVATFFAKRGGWRVGENEHHANGGEQAVVFANKPADLLLVVGADGLFS